MFLLILIVQRHWPCFMPGILYDGFHDFIHVRVRGHLPGDKEKMLAKLNGIIQEYEGKEPVYSFVQGECPDLEYCDDGKAVWDMDRKTS